MAEIVEVEWSNNLCIRLIQEYEKRAELWDPHHELFRVNSSKYDAWMELAQMFSCDIADVRKKLNSLFASHRREKAKVRSGAKSTWFLYPYMKFKRPGMENDDDFIEKSRFKKPIPKPTSIQHQTDSESDEEEVHHYDPDQQDDDDDETPTIIIKQEPVTVHSTIDRPQKVYYMEHSVRRQKRKVDKRKKLQRRIIKPPTERVETSSSNLDHRLLETLKLLRKSDLMKKKDDCDSFGEYIANSLRKHDDKTQSMIKQAINNILFEQEMKKYSECAIVLEVDENPLILGNEK